MSASEERRSADGAENARRREGEQNTRSRENYGRSRPMKCGVNGKTRGEGEKEVTNANKLGE